MPSLREQLSTGNKRELVIDDALRVLDQEVADKSGITGIAIKAAYAFVKGVKPGFLREVVDNLTNDFVDAMDAVYQEAIAKGEKPSVHFERERTRVANSLLAITDRRAERAKNKAIQSTYNKLRPTAQKHVEAAVPRLGKLVEQHASG
jgi:hypothetical protein